MSAPSVQLALAIVGLVLAFFGFLLYHLAITLGVFSVTALIVSVTTWDMGTTMLPISGFVEFLTVAIISIVGAVVGGVLAVQLVHLIIYLPVTIGGYVVGSYVTAYLVGIDGALLAYAPLLPIAGIPTFLIFGVTVIALVYGGRVVAEGLAARGYETLAALFGVTQDDAIDPVDRPTHRDLAGRVRADLDGTRSYERPETLDPLLEELKAFVARLTIRDITVVAGLVVLAGLGGWLLVDFNVLTLKTGGGALRALIASVIEVVARVFGSVPGLEPDTVGYAMQVMLIAVGALTGLRLAVVAHNIGIAIGSAIIGGGLVGVAVTGTAIDRVLALVSAFPFRSLDHALRMSLDTATAVANSLELGIGIAISVAAIGAAFQVFGLILEM